MLTSIRQWVEPPFFQGDDDKSRAAMLLNLVLWISIAATILYGVFAPVNASMAMRRTAIITSFVLTLLLIKQMVNRGYVRSAGALLVFVLWLLITVAMILEPDETNPAFMGYLVVVVCAGLILNWRASIGWSVVCILTSALILILGRNNILPQAAWGASPFAFWFAQSIYILVCTVLLSQAIRKIDEAFARAHRELIERKRVEAEREQMIRELEAKNAELERFTYTVSHDLKSPLITISGFVGLLEADSRSGNLEKFQGDLRRIKDASEKMKRLLDELLELSRIGRIVNPPSQIPFASLVEEALSLSRGRLLAGQIRVNVQQDLPSVYGDRRRLVEVLQNLIDNAAKFMGDIPSPTIDIGVRSDQGEPVFFVRDHGIGIHPSHHEKSSGCSTSSTLAAKAPGSGWRWQSGSSRCMVGASGSNQKERAREVCFASHFPSRNRSYEK